MVKNLVVLVVMVCLTVVGISHAAFSDYMIIYLEKGVINSCELDGSGGEAIMETDGEIENFLISSDSSNLLYTVPYKYRGHEFNKVYLTNLTVNTKEKVVLRGDYYFDFNFLKGSDFVTAYGQKETGDVGMPETYHKYLAVIGGKIKKFDCPPTEHLASIIGNNNVAIFAKTGKGESNKIKIFDIYSGKTRIIKLPMTLIELNNPVLSPNGHYLAYYDKGREGMDAVIYDLDKRKAVNRFYSVYTYPSCATPPCAIWGKDSKTILFQTVNINYKINRKVHSMVLLGVNGNQTKSSIKLYTKYNSDFWVVDYLTKDKIDKILLMKEEGKEFNLYLSDFKKMQLVRENLTMAQFCKR